MVRRNKSDVRPTTPAAADDEASARIHALLDVAARAFLDRGFEGTSVGEIARLASASKETIYSRFQTKEQLFKAVMRRVVGRFAERLDLALSAPGGPEVVLSAFGDVMLQRILSDEGVGLQNIVFMESRRFPDIATQFYEMGPKRTILALAGYLDKLVAQRKLRKLESEIAASHFMGLLHSDVMMRKALGLLATLTPHERTRRVESAVEVFLRAYGLPRALRNP